MFDAGNQPAIDILRKEIERKRALTDEEDMSALTAQLEALENEVLQRMDLLDLDEDIVAGLPYEVDADAMWSSATP
jgi:hypothetical protein